MTYQNPILTVDAVLLTLIDGRLYVALMDRNDPEQPFFGVPALPGGYVHADPLAGQVDQDAFSAMQRILAEKLKFQPSHLEQVYTETGDKRDPRGWSSSIVHMALQPAESVLPLVDAGAIRLVEVLPSMDLPDLAFDHRVLVENTLQRLRAKAAYSTIVAHLLPPEFSFPDYHSATEAVLQRTINPSSFRRKIFEAGVLVALDDQFFHVSGRQCRPSQAYKLRAHLEYFDREVA